MTAWLAVFPLLAGCEERDRSNPFDPENPETHGTPALLDARAGNGQVTVKWELPRIDDIREVNLYRRLLPEGPELLLSPGGLDLASDTYVDTAVSNTIGYAYRMEFVLASGSRRTSEWDAATPGRAIPWVADADGGGLLRLTPDGRDLLLRAEQGLWFLDLAADTLTSTIWSADYLTGSLFQHDSAGGRLIRSPLDGARAVCLSPEGASIWAASFRDGRIERRTPDGSTAWTESTGSHIEDLLFASDGALWSAGWLEAGDGEVRIYREDWLTGRIRDFNRPVALAETPTGRILVLDLGDRQIRAFTTSGGEVSRSGQIFTSPSALCGDGSDGVWVADPGRGALVHLGPNLGEIGAIDLPELQGVTLDLEEGRIWAVGRKGIHVLDLEGRLISRLGVGGSPAHIELLYDRGEK